MKPEEINYGKQNTWHYEAFSRLLEFEQGRQMRCRSTRPAACRLVLIEILTDRAKLEQILKPFVLRGPVACLKKKMKTDMCVLLYRRNGFNVAMILILFERDF
jgi:hypothetical protein